MLDRVRFEREVELLVNLKGLATGHDGELEWSGAQKECKKRWESFRTALPEPVRKALDDLDYELAVASAVHYGIRDVRKLTDMVFYTNYGPVHDYCKIRKGTRLPGGDLYTKLWSGFRDKLVLPALARPSPPVPQQGAIVCIRREVKRAKAQSDNPSVEITGRYEYTHGSPADHFVFRINQAGRHIECFSSAVLSPKDARTKRELWFLHGDLQSDGSFTVFSRKNAKWFWRIVRSGNGLQIEGMGKKSPLMLASSGPTLMGKALEGFQDFDLVRLSEWFPLTQQQIRHLVDGLHADKINPFLKHFFDQAGGDRVHERIDRHKAARRLDEYIHKVFDDPQRGLHQHDFVLARFYARTILTRNKWKLGYTRSQMDWIQFIVARIAQDQKELLYIPGYLGLTFDAGLNRDRSTPLHKYKVTLKLRGVGFFVHYWRGTIRIEKTSGDNKWTDSYSIWLIAVEAGMTLKLSDSITGEGESSFDWKQPDFPGRVSMGKVEAGITVGPGKLSSQAGFIHIYGRGYLTPLDIYFKDLIDVSAEGEFDKKEGKRLPRPKGFDVSIGPGGAWGKIGDKSFPDIDYSSAQSKTDYAVEYSLNSDVHFCLDSALLTEDARQALRILCANELPAFMSSTSDLTILGHTDRSDPREYRKRKEAEREKYNETLSALRAQNTLQAIKDILETKFAILDKQVKRLGHGEREAKNDNRPDDEVNPKYRRVDVILNARLVLTLKAL